MAQATEHNKMVRLPPPQKAMLDEMAKAEGRQQMYQLALIVEEGYKEWKKVQRNG